MSTEVVTAITTTVVTEVSSVKSRQEAPDAAGTWVLYLLECTGGRLYTGITNRLEHRLAAHAAGRGARFTRSFPPIRLVATMACVDRSAASRAEAAVKKLPRASKAVFFRAPSTPPKQAAR